MQFSNRDGFGIPKLFYIIWFIQIAVALAFVGLVIWGAVELGTAVIGYLEANS